MAGIFEHGNISTASLIVLSRNASTGPCSTFWRNCRPGLIGSLSSSVFRRLTPLSHTATANGSSFPHSLTPVTTSSAMTISNHSTTLAIIIASIAAGSLIVLTVITLLFLKWRRQDSIFRLDLPQDFEAKPATEPAAFLPISSTTLQRMTNNSATSNASANRDLFGDRAAQSSQVLGPRWTL